MSDFNKIKYQLIDYNHLVVKESKKTARRADKMVDFLGILWNRPKGG